MNIRKKRKTLKKLKKRHQKKGTIRRLKQKGGKLCNLDLIIDRNNKNGNKNENKNENNDIYEKGDIIYNSTYYIYEDKNNKNVLIKQIGPEYNFYNYLLNKIEYEFEASKIASKLGIGPEIYYDTICADSTDYEKIIGYLVMKKIDGKIMKTHFDIDKYIDEIYSKINILYDNDIFYNDFHIGNFLIDNFTDNVYIIDYGDICNPKETYCTRLTKEEIKNYLYQSLTNKY